MGNLQSGDSKGQKSGKSQARGKGLMKTFNKKSPGKESQKTILSKKSQQSFVSLVSDNERVTETAERVTVQPEGSADDVVQEQECASVSVTLNDSEEHLLLTTEPTLCQESQENLDNKPVDNTGFIVTDSWKEVRKYGATGCKQISPTSDESSSESVFTDPLTPVGFEAEINQCYYSRESVDKDRDVPKANDEYEEEMRRNKIANLGRADSSEKSGLLETHLNADTLGLETKNSSTPFTVSRHRKVELAASTKLTEANATETKNGKRHSVGGEHGYGDSPSNVLRKVASLTLDRATSDSKVPKVRLVPEKLDLRSCEKFEGQMLVNWLVAGAPPDQHAAAAASTRQTLTSQQQHYLQRQHQSKLNQQQSSRQQPDVRQLVVSCCQSLLAAGVLKQIAGPQDPLTDVFRPDLMYYWNHSSDAARSAGEPGPAAASTPTHQSARPSRSLSDSTVNNENELYVTADSISAGLVRTPVQFGSRLPRSSVSTPKPAGEHAKQSHEKDERISQLEDANRQLRQELEELRSFGLDSHSSAQQNSADSGVTTTSSINSADESLSPLKLSRRANGSNLCDLKVVTKTFHVAPLAAKPVVTVAKKDMAVQTDECIQVEAKSPVTVSLHSPRGSVSDAKCDEPKDVASKTNGDTSAGASDRVGSVSSENTSNGAKSAPAPPPPPPVPDTSETRSQPESGLSTNAPPPPPPPPMPECNAPPPPPPPPMPGMPPPPPPMTGIGVPAPPPPPPPPPMSGMCGPPPPPPMPGMGGPPPPPPPPMPGMGGPPPPPPPMPGMGGPPPPPPPPMPGMGGPPPPPPPAPGLGPPPPPPPMGLSPKPFPTPPPGGWNPAQRESLRKPPVTPPVPMKPLYWTRILSPKAVVMAPTQEAEDILWQELEEANINNLQKFTDLFSRQVVTKKPTVKKVAKPTKAVSVKILDGKRSQNVGILAQSLHVDFSEIENAVYNFDTSVVNLEALQQIYESRATPEELTMIKDHVASNKDVPLDKPEQFLYDLSEIQCFADRISCFMFQVEFEDSVTTLSNNVSNLKALCEVLLNDNDLKKVLAIILKLGNLMNGGNRMRGQADGFGLEILAKLKDVKSKDNQITLLHFIVETYLEESQEPRHGLPLPVPNPWDVSRAAEVDFEEVAKVIDKLKMKLDACSRKMEIVIQNSAPENLQPFKDKMKIFIENANTAIENEKKSMNECKNKFIQTMRFYSFRPKTGTIENCPTNEFFALWIPFCKDFEQIWKKEQQRLLKQKVLQETAAKNTKARLDCAPKTDKGRKARIQRMFQSKK